MRILFITANRLGDAVLSTALLRHLLAAYPAARFTIACGPVAAGLFARMPRCERLIVVEKQRFDLHWWHLWRKLTGTRFDLAVDLRGSALTWLLACGQRHILRGGRRPGHKLAHLAELLGIKPPPLPIAFIAAADHAAAAALLPQQGPLIGLGPTANWAGKIWPEARFAALFTALARAHPGARAVIFAGPGAEEQRRAASLRGLLPAAVDCSAVHELPLVAALLSRMALFIGNDSGLMHLAAASGAPTLGLFGPTFADEYAPRGAIADFVCAGGPRDAAPMQDLSVAQAEAAASALLARAAAAGS